MSVEEQLARSLTDEALADRLLHLAQTLRGFTPAFREAVLREAARRLVSR